MIINLSGNIQSTYEGYQELISMLGKISVSSDTNAEIDFSDVWWFEANLCAVLGAVIQLTKAQGKKVSLLNFKQNVKDILQRNMFLCEFGEVKLPNTGNTIVPYMKFSPSNDNEFLQYIRSELLEKPDFPRHTERLGKKISESIFELFENARTHGKCAVIHTCGQYYPNKVPKRLDLTIVDMGNTIKKNVNEYLGTDKSGPDAILWALQYGNTTKTGSISGGLGLDIIFQFIKLNKGKIQIASSDGYWEYREGNEFTATFSGMFPGTIANLEFNLDDDSRYYLSDENPNDLIF